MLKSWAITKGFGIEKKKDLFFWTPNSTFVDGIIGPYIWGRFHVKFHEILTVKSGQKSPKVPRWAKYPKKWHFRPKRRHFDPKVPRGAKYPKKWHFALIWVQKWLSRDPQMSDLANILLTKPREDDFFRSIFPILDPKKAFWTPEATFGPKVDISP